MSSPTVPYVLGGTQTEQQRLVAQDAVAPAFAAAQEGEGACTHYDREASVYRFVGPKRIERIAGVYEAGVAAVA